MRGRAARALQFGQRVLEQRQKKREEICNAPHTRKLRPREFGSVSLTPPESLAQHLEGFRSVSRRRDTPEVARLYTTGLLSDLPRKNGETIAVTLGVGSRTAWQIVQQPELRTPRLFRRRA